MSEAVIVGGGLAGGAAAIQLARASHGVHLLERECEPVDKICGEFLSIEAQRALDRLGIDLDRLGASRIGTLLCEKILVERSHPEQGFRACLGIVRLVKSFGRERVEAACSRALDIEARTFGSVKSILDNGLDRLPSVRSAAGQPIDHPNIRGPDITTEGDESAATSYPRTADQHGLRRHGAGVRRIGE